MRIATAWTQRAREAAVTWKASTSKLPDAARASGHYFIEERGEAKRIGPFPFCLPTEYAELNLLDTVRPAALSLFRRHAIQWHAGTPGEQEAGPSTHLLDSQVQCVNVLLALAAKPELLLCVVRRVVPDAEAVIPLESGSLVAFEWIGLADYLGEGRRGRPRTRGRFATSADALLVVRRRDGGHTAIVVEWKFTESYDCPIAFQGHRGTDRREVYRYMYEAGGSPFPFRPAIEAFFHEPHYQLMRLALLAASMVAAAEFGVDEAILLHMIPSANTELLALVPDGLIEFGRRVDTVWRYLLPGPIVRYEMVDTLPLMSCVDEVYERYGALTCKPST